MYKLMVFFSRPAIVRALIAIGANSNLCWNMADHVQTPEPLWDQLKERDDEKAA